MAYTKVKTPAEIEAMRRSCAITAQILSQLAATIEAGMTGRDLDHLAVKEAKALGATPAFMGYGGFPASLCVSVNEAVVHGIPGKRPFAAGDLVGLDFGVSFDGMISDSALTVVVGGTAKAKPEVARLLAGTEEALVAAIKVVREGAHLGDIGAAAQAVLERHGLGIVRDLVGHGVGHAVHEEPNIPNYGTPGQGDRLRAGMTIALEPMATLGGDGVQLEADGWTIATKDGSLAAHFEHTVLVTKDGSEVLTKRS